MKTPLLSLIIVLLAHGVQGAPSIVNLTPFLTQAQNQNAAKQIAAEAVTSPGCPMLKNFHGKRSSSDVDQDQEANNLLLAVKLLLTDGYGVNELKALNDHFRNFCPSPDFDVCDPVSSYRTADGSCNNLQKPTYGMAGVAQKRLVPPAYDDGIGSPRTVAVDGSPLPNPRLISNNVHRGGANLIVSQKITLHTFQMGQFLDHDIIATPTQRAISDCCSDAGKADDQNCFNIIVPQDDAYNPMFVQDYCMGVDRSSPMFCPDGLNESPSNKTYRRQQQNVITSFIDASNVYGSSKVEQDALRHGAFLKTEPSGRLPNNLDQTFCKSNNTAGQYCSQAGDHRVNVVPTLTSYHNVFVLEHNRIATLLSSTISDPETLFQATRKILIGIMQKIVYDEFLPSFLSQTMLTEYDLLSSSVYQYDQTIDPTIANGFGIAFRLGHSWIPREMSVYDRDFQEMSTMSTDQAFNDPSQTYFTNSTVGMQGLAYYLSAVNSPNTDRIIEEDARSRLFINVTSNHAFDIAALNIQRGRDHGLPPYNKYRKFCNLSYASSWNDTLEHHDGETIEKLQAAGYNSPEDIDLFTGALTEIPVSGSTVGPTLECILGDQFRRLKFGDRFWYQGGATGFSADQQAAIETYSMAKLLCENYNFDEIHYPNVFDTTHSLTSCSDIPELNVEVFKLSYQNSAGQSQSSNNNGGQNQPSNSGGQNQPSNNNGGQNQPSNNNGGQNQPSSNSGGQNQPSNNSGR